MDRVTKKIWLGDALDASSLKSLQANHITGVLNVAKEIQCSEFDGIVCNKISLVDGAGNDPERLLYSVSVLKRLLKDHKCVLVHCAAGISRSATVLAMHLSISHGMSFEEAVNLLQKKRPVVDPHPDVVETALLVLRGKESKKKRKRKQPLLRERRDYGI